MHPQDKFNQERCDAILKSISDRIPNKYAARAAGVSENKLYKWLNQGLADLENDLATPKAKFCIEFSKIEQKIIKGHLDAIKGSPERWQAHAWILERRYWRDFSPNGPLTQLAKRIEQMELSAELKEELNGEIKGVKKEQTPKE
jgi:hypothetical protein